MIKTKRVYNNYKSDDGVRILVDGLWPRGITKKRAHLSLWLNAIAPSRKLRKWYSHDINKWNNFKKRYFNELSSKKELIKLIKEMSNEDNVTLLYGAKDSIHNNAAALKDYIFRNKRKYPN